MLFPQTTTKIDSLVTVLETAKEDTSKVIILNKLGIEYGSKGEALKAIQYELEALSLAIKINYKRGAASAYLNLGNLYPSVGNYKEAENNLKTALTIFQELGIKKSIAYVYNGLGIVYSRQGNYPEAMNSYLLALKFHEEVGNKKSMANCYNNIGILCSQLGNYSEALNYYNLALKIREEIGDKYGLADSYNNIGTAYNKLENYPEALKNQIISLKIKEEIGDKFRIADTYSNIGEIYFSQGNYSEALNNYRISLNIREEIGDKTGMVISFNSIANVYSKQAQASKEITPEVFKKYNEASKYLNKGLMIAKEIGYKRGIIDAYEVLSDLYKAQGKYEQSLENFELYTIYKDSLLNEENNNEIANLKIQYETEKKDREIDLLDKENELQEQQLARQKLQRNGVIITMAFLILVGFLLFRSQHLRKKLEKQAAIIQERRRISADLHDDIGTGLSKISLLSELVRRQAKTPETKAEAEKIARTSRELLDRIREIIWALNSNNDYLENLVSYIRWYASEYFESSGISLNLDEPVDIPPTPINGEYRRNVFYSVKEAMHNIVKHAEATEAEIKFRLEKGLFSISVNDNGKGIPEVKHNRFGNGIKNIMNRMEAVKGNVRIENHGGTKITMTMPV